MTTPDPNARPAAVDALRETLEQSVDFSWNYATAKPDIGETEKMHILGLCYSLKRAINALAAPTGPAAVDEEMARRFKVAFHAARDVGTPYDEGIQHGLTAALAKPAQEAAPRGGGEADGRWWLNMGWTGPIVMRWRTPLGDWSRWHDYSPDKQGDVVRAGCEVDYAYPAPPAAQASDTIRQTVFNWLDTLETGAQDRGAVQTGLVRDLSKIMASDTGRGEAWRPIETAPRTDGFTALIYVPVGPPFKPHIGEATQYLRGDFAEWFWAGQHPYHGDTVEEMTGEPTHWMPLPEPPVDSHGR